MTITPKIDALIAALVLVGTGTASAQILDVRELKPSQIAALDRSRTVVMLTGGILEEHGPYLPAFSDGYQSEFVTTKVAEAIVARPGWVVLRWPMIPLGTMPANEVAGRYSFPGSYAVRFTTLRAVFMDLLTDLGEAGFKWGFILNLHGSPTHNRALDEAARYFSDTFGGRVVDLSGLASVAGAVPRDIFSPAQRSAEGFSVHADADEHSRMLFLRPDLVRSDVSSAPPVVAHSFPELIASSTKDDWPGYWGTPSIATAAAGARAMGTIAQAAVDTALKILDGAPDAALTRIADQTAANPDVAKLVGASLEHERQIEQRQNEWIAKNRR
jgi:creatinine amidohydrolase/Fe(II)-dependent formamide hydrolase-like protein